MTSDHPTSPRSPQEQGHLCSVHGNLETVRATVQTQGNPRWDRCVDIAGEALSSQSQGGRSSGALRLGLGDATVDPGEVLLRLITQSAARAERYALLLEEAYEAAERLKQAHDAGAQIEASGDELADTAETARRDLDRILNTGGVAALVGNTYGAAKDVGVYVTGEAIRELADLEAKEHERFANLASKVVTAASPSAPYGLPSDKAS
jgi:hypothetical protein